jgi:hypothetical protein
MNEQNGSLGKSDREAMWKFVTDGGVALVRDVYGNLAYVRAKTNSRGTHYLQTEADGKLSDNLLHLNEC